MFFLALFSLPTFSYFILQQPRVQQLIVQKITTLLSDYFGSNVTIGKANIDLFNNITFKNFCVQSPAKDTILFAPEFSFRLNSFTLASKYIDVMSVTIKNPKINFKIDSDGVINFQYIINKVKSTSTSGKLNKPIILSIRDIKIINANFSLKATNNSPKAYGINFSDIHVNPVNLMVTGFSVNEGEINMNIRHIDCTEKSGFILRDFASQLKIYKYYMVFNHIKIVTDKSNINASKVHFNFDDFREFGVGIFGKKVKMDLDVRSSEFSTDDLAYFSTVFKDYKLSAKVSGKVRGILNDLKGKNIEVYFRNGTKIRGNVNISGLPDFSKAFIYADIKNCITTPEDIQHITLPGSKSGHIVLPDNFKKIDYITYNGQFTGLFNDFVAYGVIKSNLGNIESDLSLKPDSTGVLNFKGRVITSGFNLGVFVKNQNLLGNISFNVLVNGRVNNFKNLSAELDGVVSNVFMKGYNYQNIRVNGSLTNNDNYDGSVVINDPNLDADFKGTINMSDRSPLYSFKVNIRKANLYKLKFDNSDTSSFMSISASSDFSGKTLDDLNGEVKLSNITFRKSKKEIHINDFILFNKTVNDTNRIFIKSDLADVNIGGFYHYKDLVNSFKKFAGYYLPSIVPENRDNDTVINKFTFNIDLKNTHQVTDYFVPGLYISKDTKIHGNFNSENNGFNFLVTIPLLQKGTIKWYNAYVNGKSDGKVFSVISGCNSLKLDKLNKLDNFTVIAELKSDSIKSQFRWNNWDTLNYKGNISMITTINRRVRDKNPVFDVDIKPSQIVIRDSVWNLSSGVIVIDSSDININNFTASHNNQLIRVYGDISENKDKILNLEFEKLNIGIFTDLINAQKWNPEGILSGKTEFSSLYDELLFHGVLRIDSLSINNQKFGEANINTEFSNSDKNINIQATTTRNGNNIFSAKGLYSIETRKIAFDINANHLQIKLFEPFVSTVFSDIHGETSGNLYLSGTIKSPVLDGRLHLDNVLFTVNYLKTNYHFNGNVNVEKNKFIVKNFEVFDRYNITGSGKEHKALVNGIVDVGVFKEVSLDITVNANNLECLNTTEKDNIIYYGNGFGTGILSVKGPLHNIEINSQNIVNNKESNIYIPLETKSELAESNFIKRVVKRRAEHPFEQYEIDTDSSQNNLSYNNSGVKVNLTFTLNTDAQVQLIFDEKIGDKIEGNGNGSLKMTYENGNFSMEGNYIIEKGDYLYTLGNLINKRFILNQGGLITWDGSPWDAIINMEAYYPITAASLTDLLPQISQTGLITQTGKVKVNCNVKLTERLLNPNIKLDITLPNADQSTQDLVKSTISTDEEKVKQFAALMAFGTFMPSSEIPAQGASQSVAYTTSMEFVSNQLSNWFSKFGNANINLNYKPYDPNTAINQDFQVGIATQLNSKVSFTGNVDYGGDPRNPAPTATASNNIPIADAELDYKLTKNGKLQFKTFTRPNQSIDAVATSQQGVGIVYKEDFNSFVELLKHYYSIIIRRKEDKITTLKKDSGQNDGSNN